MSSTDSRRRRAAILAFAGLVFAASQTGSPNRATGFAWPFAVLAAAAAEAPAVAEAKPRGARVVVNQVGFRPGLPKQAFAVDFPEDARVACTLLRFADDDGEFRDFDDPAIHRPAPQEVLEIEAGAAFVDGQSRQRLQVVDFSMVRLPGRYRVRCGDESSQPFRIAERVYDGALRLLLRSYYLQRCGPALKDAETGLAHEACHSADAKAAVVRAGEADRPAIDGSGGWHDAGDFGKYVSTTAVAVGQVLHLVEFHAEALVEMTLGIPESGNAVPDVIDEMIVGLDWMLSMQRSDGAVYRKLSGERWPAPIAPDDDTQRRFAFGVSTPETAKFAAAMAQASRVIGAHDARRAEEYLGASRLAWKYLQSVEGQRIDWAGVDDSGSGPYVASDTDTEEALSIDRDDRLWAAAELAITTGEQVFLDTFSAWAIDRPYTLFEWKDPSALGLMNFYLSKDVPDPRSIRERIEARLIERAEISLERMTRSGYRVANPRFVWGSNKMTAQEGVTLVYAHRLTGDPRYLRAAADQLDYLLGRNPFGQTFVSGLGSAPVTHVAHLWVRASGKDIPGLFVGGPNSRAQAGIAPKDKGILSYADDARSYATNEYAIDYNSALIALIVLLSSG